MRDLSRILTVPLLTFACATVHAQSDDVDELLEQIVAASSAGYEGINDLTRKTKTMGTINLEHYEKAPPFEVDGMTVHSLQMVPFSEIQRRHNAAAGLNSPSATEMAAAADQVEMAGIDMERAMVSEMQTTGLPGGLGPMLMNPPPDQPWLSANPRDMTSMYAMMLRAGADAEAQMAAEQAGMPAEYTRNMREMRSKMRVNGFSTYNDREVVDIGADGLNMSQVSNGQEMNCQSMEMLIDTEWYVPVYFKMNCSVADGGETRQMSIERDTSDFRTVPGCGSYREPFRAVMRIGGVMTPEQQAQMAEASVQLEEFEKQLASMPPEQRKMMEGMMGGQLDMIRGMASGGGVMEIVQETLELRCNTGLPDPAEFSQTFMGGMAVPAAALQTVTRDNLLQMIQVDLEKLGYGPGNTQGLLDKPTAVAIAKFQAEKGMEVTGQPSPQLAGVLQAAAQGTSTSELTADYLAGFWCTERMQERELYNFAADGSYRLGVVGMTITQMDGLNYFPETFSYQSFLDKFQSVASKDQDRFTVVIVGGSTDTFLRGNCIK